MPRILLKELGNADTGGVGLPSAHAIRCWVKSHNERNPRVLLLPLSVRIEINKVNHTLFRCISRLLHF